MDTDLHLRAISGRRMSILEGGDVDLDELADKIADRISRKAASADVLWDGHDCAEYLCVTRRHFVDRIAKRKGFPAERATGARWLRSEVIRWAKSR